MRHLLAVSAFALAAASCATGVTDGGEAVSRSGDSVLAGENNTTSAVDAPAQSTAPDNGSETTVDDTEPVQTSESASRRVTCTAVAPSGDAVADITASSGIDEALLGMRGHAVAAGDVDADGDIDVFVGGFADRPLETYQVRGADGPSPDVLLLREGDRWIVDTTFPETFGRSSGAAFADLDDDGDLDLVVARNPRSGERASAPSEVLVNDGGTFSSSTVLDGERGLRSIGVLDYDGDGLLDLYLVEDRFTGGDSRLLRNLGGLAFEDVTSAAGLPDGVAGLGVAAVDLDRSGTPDLFVGGDNRLFLNIGGRFEEVAGPFAWQTFGDEDDVAGVAVGDLDGDGWLDLVVGQHFNSTLDQQRSVPVRAYLHRGLDGDGRPVFEDATDLLGLVGLPTKAPHVEVVDVDGDGDVDIVTSASAQDGSLPAVLFNDGGSTPSFSTPDGMGAAQYWVAGATFDSDGDASPEMFAVEWEPALGSRLFDFPSSQGGFATVQVGSAGAEGVGAVVTATRSGSGEVVAVVPIVASAGYGSGVPPVAQLGLGAVDAVDVRIDLPWQRGTIEIQGVTAGSSIIARVDGSWSCSS